MPFRSDIIEKIDRPLVLVGMMGSGKSHVGKILSDMLDFSFYDSDELITEDQGLSIADIFTQRGEAVFRKLEADKILSLLDERKPCIISTGGGAVINPTVLNSIKEYSFSIWLMADIPTLLRRIEEDDNRPLMAVPDREKRLEELLKVRKPLYAQADIKIDNSNVNEEELREKLSQALYEFVNFR